MKVGFCGLGLMGTPMARRLIAAGHEVWVWNRSAGKAAQLAAEGARVATTPHELADQCELVCLCLYDAAAVESVVFGEAGLASSRVMKTLVDHSSIPPDATRDMAARLSRQTGAAWIDAPVSGGTGGAQQGTLAIMAGGDEAAIAAVAPVLRAYGQRITRMGHVGAGQATKLCNQTIVASTVAAIGEAVALAQASGVDAARLAEALAGGWADSTLLQTFVPRMTRLPETKQAAVATMLKDLDAVAALAQAVGTPMPISAAAQQLYRAAVLHGLADEDISHLVRMSAAA